MRSHDASYDRHSSTQKAQAKNRLTRQKSSWYIEKPPERRERKTSDAPTMSRRSNIFRRAWQRRVEDDRWVLVEVQAVVTDRVLDE